MARPSYKETADLMERYLHGAVIMYDFGPPHLGNIITALDRQVPAKPIYSEYDDNGDGTIIPYKAICPDCEHEFEFGTWNDKDNHHCICGQKMDWSKEDSNG